MSASQRDCYCTTGLEFNREYGFGMPYDLHSYDPAYGFVVLWGNELSSNPGETVVASGDDVWGC